MILRKGSKGKAVKRLQQFLGLKKDGYFGPITETAVKNWQRQNNLKVDGIVGPITLNAMGLLDSDLSQNNISVNLNYKKYFLKNDEYYTGSHNKQWIFLHHTAGWHNPEQVVKAWEEDKRGRVGTEWILGGQSIQGNDNTHDGKLVQCMPPDGYAWHLTIGNNSMHRDSIGIEICNFGFLTKGGYWKGKNWIGLEKNNFYTYVGTKAHESQIVNLGKKFRGFQYWHRYSDKQIKILKDWVLFIAERDDIDPRKGLVELIHKVGGFKAFDTCDVNMCQQNKGLWLHTNVIQGKVDLFPQQEVIDMLMTL